MRSIKLGMLGAGLIIALIGVLLYVETSFPDLGILDNKILIAAVLLAVLGIGILITWLSTHFATQKFLNLRTDDLY
jgi:cell division transport system permease protein